MNEELEQMLARIDAKFERLDARLAKLEGKVQGFDLILAVERYLA